MLTRKAAESASREERALKAWQERAQAALGRFGRGGRALCARETGCSPDLLSPIINGRIARSHWQATISRWLGIPPPDVPGELAEQWMILERLEEGDRDFALAFLRRLAAAAPLPAGSAAAVGPAVDPVGAPMERARASAPPRLRRA